jgi:hypothetical protein
MERYCSTGQSPQRAVAPTEEEESGPCSQIRARDQLPSMSLCPTGTTPQCQMLFLHAAFHLSSYILPRDPQERFRSSRPLNRTIPCGLATKLIIGFVNFTKVPKNETNFCAKNTWIKFHENTAVCLID